MEFLKTLKNKKSLEIVWTYKIELKNIVLWIVTNNIRKEFIIRLHKCTQFISLCHTWMKNIDIKFSINHKMWYKHGEFGLIDITWPWIWNLQFHDHVSRVSRPTTFVFHNNTHIEGDPMKQTSCEKALHCNLRYISSIRTRPFYIFFSLGCFYL
jgi:hypothetical protein